MRCYRNILHISYKDHVTNKEVRAKIQQVTGPHEDLLTIVKRLKLQWYGHVSLHQVWPKPSCKAQWKGEEDKADRGRGGKTKSGNGQAWSSASPRGQWRTGRNGENWLQNHLWCPNDLHGLGIDDDNELWLHNITVIYIVAISDVAFLILKPGVRQNVALHASHAARNTYGFNFYHPSSFGSMFNFFYFLHPTLSRYSSEETFVLKVNQNQ